ncbi:hypothetical protein [Nocardioides gansuensis]|uniref:hypothetical protein n=1 Tax=Nocardioides gansuensis TaxID=2138300 RepID=UPI001FE314B3|nr:hypothetical protein [Nocardioides gansuensis]
MSSLVKVLVVLALVLPMMAYVVGSLVASGAGEPSDRDPVIIRDAPASEPAPRGARPRAPDDDGRETDDNEVRVVTPRPSQVGSDEGERQPEEDDDDSTTGDGSADDDGRDDGSHTDEGSDDGADDGGGEDDEGED